MNYLPFKDKDEFADSVSALFDEYPDTQERIDVVQRMTNEYFARFGCWSEPHELSRLGTYILRESDGQRAKPARKHLSPHQIRRRLRREVGLDPARATRCTERKLYGKRKTRLPAGKGGDVA